MVQCYAYTRRGIRCKNHILRDRSSIYCKVHQKYVPPPKEAVSVKERSVYNLACPICLEECEVESPFLLFSCNHRMHQECMKGMLQGTCPYCRKDLMEELPDDVKKCIENTQTKERIERVQREHEDLRHQEERRARRAEFEAEFERKFEEERQLFLAMRRAMRRLELLNE